MIPEQPWLCCRASGASKCNRRASGLCSDGHGLWRPRPCPENVWDEGNGPYLEEESLHGTASAYFSGLQSGMSKICEILEEDTRTCIPIYFSFNIYFYVFCNLHNLIQQCIILPYKKYTYVSMYNPSSFSNIGT